MTLKKPTIVLFDMDGTTVRHIDPKLLSILEWLDDVSLKTSKGLSKAFKRKIHHSPLVEIHDGKRRKLLVHRALHRMRRKDVAQIVEPCPGITDLLNFLQAQDVTLGIISNGLGKGYGHDILKTFDLEQFFKVTVFREDIQRAKPNPDPILKAMNEIDHSENDVIWYIGDRNKDILAAIAARDHLPCPITPFAYNVNAALAILNNGFGPDHIIMAWKDFETKIRKLFEKK